MMMISSAKRWVAIGALVLLTSISLFAQQADKKKKGCGADDFRSDKTKKCAQVAEGGSTAAYLFLVGSTCLGAMVIRSRFKKPHLS